MRRGAIIIIAIAMAVAALLHSRRKPLEDAREDGPYGDWPFIPLSGAGGFLLSSLRADAGRGARTCVPALYSEAVEQDGWITIHATNNATKGQRDHGH